MTHISIHKKKKSAIFEQRKGDDKILNIKTTPPLAQLGLGELRHSHPPPSPTLGFRLGKGAMPGMGLVAGPSPFAGLKTMSAPPRLFSEGRVSFS